MKFIKLYFILLLAHVVIACGGADERKAAYLEKAESSLKAGDYDKARIELKNVLQIDPKDARAYFKMGYIFERKGEFRQAFGSYNKAVEQDPENTEYQAKLGRFYLILAQDIEKATEIMNLILSKDEKNIDGLLLKAGILLKQDKSAEAKNIIITLSNNEPGNTEVASFLGSIYKLEKDYDSAITTLEKAISLNQGDQQLMLELANIYIENKNINKAEQVLKDILIAHPDVFRNYTALAKLQQINGQPDKAEATLRDAINNDENSVERRLVLIEFLQQTKGNDVALNELESIVNNNKVESAYRLALARLQLLMRMNDEAISTFKNIIKEFSTEEAGVTSRLQLVKIYLERKDIDTATRYLDEATEISPNDTEVNMIKAKLALLNKNLEQAIISLRIVIKNDTDNIEAYALLAQAHKANNEVNQAQDVMTRAYENNRTSPDHLLILAKYHLNTGDVTATEKIIDELLKINPKNYEALSIKAGILNDSKKYAEANAIAEKLIMDYSEKEAGYILSVPYLLSFNKIDNAISLLESGYQKTKSLKILKLKAELLISNNKQDEALADLGKINADDMDESIQLLIVKAYGSKKDINSAKKALYDSINTDKTRVQSYLLLASILNNEKNTTQAITVLNGAIDSNPDDIKLHIALAGYYEHSGNFDSAIKIYDTILTKQPDNLIATNNLAAVLSEHKSDESSLNRARELADKLKPSNQPVLQDTVGWVYYKLGDYQSAIETLTKVVSAAPSVAVFNYHLGMAYYKNNQLEQAKSHLKAATEVAVDYPGKDVAIKTLGSM